MKKNHYTKAQYENAIEIAKASPNIDLESLLMLGSILDDTSFFKGNYTKEETEACLIITHGLRTGNIEEP